MKKVFLNGGILAALLALGACTTIDMFTYEDGNVYAELETNDPARVTLTLDNRGAGDLILDQNRAVYAGGGRRTPLAALGEGPESPPPLRLSPGEQGSRSFAPAEAVSFSKGKRKIAEWVPGDASGDRFEFAYAMAGSEYPLAFPDGREQPILGKVNVSLDILMPFSSTVTERRRKIYNLALSQADTALGGTGKKLRLVNLRYGSENKGLREKAALSADVIAGD
jgi:hypothetical protein